jgi:hypothetical protein
MQTTLSNNGSFHGPGGHYSNHTVQMSANTLRGAHVIGGFLDAPLRWYGYHYADSHPVTEARRFPMVVDNFGTLVEVAA